MNNSKGVQKVVKTVVLTGGPCADKSSDMTAIIEHFNQREYHVLIVAKTTTELLSSGISPSDSFSNREFQVLLLQHQLAKEDFYKSVAERLPYPKILIVLDRGAMDGKAYSSAEDWNAAVNDVGFPSDTQLLHRYDGVVHLRSIAYAHPELYKAIFAKNPVRIERTPEMAIEKDEATAHAWLGSGAVFVSSDHPNPESKADATVAAIARIIGEPVPLEVERKYLIRIVRPSELEIEGIPYKRFRITQLYLDFSSPGATAHDDSYEKRVRMMQEEGGGSAVYFLTEKWGSGLARIERESIITRQEFDGHISERSLSSSSPIPMTSKTRTTFQYQDNVFEIDEFDKPLPQGDIYAVMEVELASVNDRPNIPLFIDIVADITGDTYSNLELALHWLEAPADRSNQNSKGE